MTRRTRRAAAQQAHAEGRKTTTTQTPVQRPQPAVHGTTETDNVQPQQRVETASRQEGQDFKKHANEGPPGPRHDQTSGSTTRRRAGAAQGRNEHEDAEPTEGVEPIDQQEDRHRRGRRRHLTSATRCGSTANVSPRRTEHPHAAPWDHQAREPRPNGRRGNHPNGDPAWVPEHPAW